MVMTVGNVQCVLHTLEGYPDFEEDDVDSATKGVGEQDMYV